MGAGESRESQRQISEAPVYQAHFNWNIRNFEKTLNLCDVGESLESDIFGHSQTPELRWRLELWPSGDTDATKDHVSVFLYLSRTPFTKLKVVAVLNVGSHEGCFQSVLTGAGLVLRVPRKDVQLCRDGSLLVRARVEYRWCQGLLSRAATSGLRQKPGDLARIFLKDELSDVRLKVAGRELPAHKAVLAAHSEVFARMFTRDQWVESAKGAVVEIRGLGNDPERAYNSLRDFLSFIYTGTFFLQAEENRGQLCLEDELALAERYDVPSLKALMEFELGAKLCAGSFCHTARLAHLHSSPVLLRACQDFLKGRQEPVDEREWKHLAKSYPEVILKLTQPLLKISPS